MSNLIKKIRTQSGDAQIDYESLANLPAPDKTLTQEGKAADAKEVGDRLSQLSDEIANLSKNGLTTEQINALDGMFKVTAFSNDPTSAYNAFKTAFGIDSGSETEKTLSSISATYNGGNVATGTSLTDLTGITVTAHYSDGSTEYVIGYSLSGEILEGENTITVSYIGLTATFTVVGIVESGGDTSEMMDIVTDVEWTDGIWLNTNNGVEAANENYTSSEKIPFSASETVTCVFTKNNLKTGILCYDSSDSFLGFVETPSYSIIGENQILTPFENTAYIRSTMTINNRTGAIIQMLITAREV